MACLIALAVAGVSRAQTTVTLSVPSGAAVVEGNGATTITVTATLSTQSSTATSIVLSLSELTATSADYQLHGSLPTILIPAGDSSATGEITLTAVDDSYFEGPQTLSVGGSGTGVTVNAVSLSIQDNDDRPTLGLSISPREAREGESVDMTFSVTLSGGDPLEQDLDLTISINDPTSEWTVACPSMSTGCTTANLYDITIPADSFRSSKVLRARAEINSRDMIYMYQNIPA